MAPFLATGVIKVFGALLPRPFGTLAQRNAIRHPRRTAAALMIGLALVTGFSVTTSSRVSSTNA